MLGKDVVDGALAALDSAKISAPLRATLAFLRKVTREHAQVTAGDIRTLRAVGVTRGQIEDALNVAFCFNVITRLADTFEFAIGPDSAFESSAKMLLKRGYGL